MDHMRISGTEVILSQTNLFKKLESDALKVPKLVNTERDGVINPLNYNSNKF